VKALRIFQITLLLVLWYFFAGLVFSRVLGIWPAGFEREGFFISAAALPWALLALDFYAPTDSPYGAVVRDALFFVVIALGIAANAVIVNGLLRAGVNRLRLRLIARERARHQRRSAPVAAGRSGRG
jgi:hypothetical protein